MKGWGRLDVTEADISFDEPGEPKTGPRSVPIPPVLVTMLREWVEQNKITSPDQLLFRTRNDTRPSGSNWVRAWHSALESVGQKPMRVYDCRHAAATTWLRAGMPLGETARRLGHRVETLVSTYVDALDDEEAVAITASTQSAGESVCAGGAARSRCLSLALATEREQCCPGGVEWSRRLAPRGIVSIQMCEPLPQSGQSARHRGVFAAGARLAACVPQQEREVNHERIF